MLGLSGKQALGVALIAFGVYFIGGKMMAKKAEG